MISRRKVTRWAATGLLTAGIVIAGLPALAQTAMAADPTPTATTTGTATSPTGVVRQRDRAGNDTYLAQALGITTDQLAAAKETARLAAIQQALDKGLITQSQADALKNNTGLGGPGGHDGLGPLVGKGQIDQDALLAQALGISTDKLAQARTAAEDARLAQAVADGTMTQAQADLVKARQALDTYMTQNNVYANAVSQAVKAGVITQAQADAILAQGGNGGFGRGGFGDFGGRGGVHGGH